MENFITPNLGKLVASGKFNGVEVSPVWEEFDEDTGQTFIEADPAQTGPVESYAGWSVYLHYGSDEDKAKHGPTVNVADFTDGPGGELVAGDSKRPGVGEFSAVSFAQILLMALGFRASGDLGWIHGDSPWGSYDYKEKSDNRFYAAPVGGARSREWFWTVPDWTA